MSMSFNQVKQYTLIVVPMFMSRDQVTQYTSVMAMFLSNDKGVVPTKIMLIMFLITMMIIISASDVLGFKVKILWLAMIKPVSGIPMCPFGNVRMVARSPLTHRATLLHRAVQMAAVHNTILVNHRQIYNWSSSSYPDQLFNYSSQCLII